MPDMEPLLDFMLSNGVGAGLRVRKRQGETREVYERNAKSHNLISMNWGSIHLFYFIFNYFQLISYFIFLFSYL